MKEELAISQRGKVEHLNHLLHSCGHYLYHHATGPRQIIVLHLLQEHGSLTQKELQDMLEVQAGSISELVSKLESKGFVERTKDSLDKRKVTITLTEKGKALSIKNPKATLHDRYAALNEDEQDELIVLLDKLLASWKEESQ